MDRRNFLKVVAATSAGVAAGCNTRNAEKLLPYLEQPEEMIPGQALYYASVCLECPAGCGILARTREGRVVKVEGNPQHPGSNGALCARGQASVQGLYNPDRLNKPMLKDAEGKLIECSWDEALNALAKIVSDNAEKTVWLSGNSSDSDIAFIDVIAQHLGSHKPLNQFLYSEMPLANAAANLFAAKSLPEFHFDKASMLVSFNADFLETWGNPVKQIHDYSKMHGESSHGHGKSVYIGTRQSNTAACCDKWIKLAPQHEVAGLRLLAEEVAAIKGVNPLLQQLPLSAVDTLPPADAAMIKEIAKVLASEKAPLVIASGLGRDPELAHSLALIITDMAGGTGTTVTFPENGRAARGDSPEEITKVLDKVKTGEIAALLVHEADPVFQSGIELSGAKGKVVFFGTQVNDTAAQADILLPVHHFLEAWGDQKAAAGVNGFIQPVMKPIFGSRAFVSIFIETLKTIGKPLKWNTEKDYIAERLEFLSAETGVALKPREIKKNGGVWSPAVLTPVSLNAAAQLPVMSGKSGAKLTAHFFPHPYLYDGRGADKPWLQEVPETATSAVWGSWAEIHPDTAKEIGVKRGDSVRLKANGKEVDVPVLVGMNDSQVMPGVIAVPIGQGHNSMGRYAQGRGANPLTICSAEAGGSSFFTAGVSVDVEALKGVGKIITMAGSQDQGERDIAKAITKKKDDHGKGEHHDEHHIDLASTFYPEKEYALYDWGMTIDLDSCVGCGACVTACYAENNLGVVGEQWMSEGREMSWLRLEKYVEGDEVRLLPNLCQQCHDAPCEPVCPVQAAYHSDEGLNAQVYNRCVGTRYCSNNCPYKVRRFNWFDYKYPDPLHLQLNPDVSVRERGVMEKCSFCVQRIKISKEYAKNEGQIIKDGNKYMDGFELMPACAQTCPAKAISFGNLEDKESKVSKDKENDRAYQLLAELGVRPSVTYLKKVIRHDW